MPTNDMRVLKDLRQIEQANQEIDIYNDPQTQAEMEAEGKTENAQPTIEEIKDFVYQQMSALHKRLVHREFYNPADGCLYNRGEVALSWLVKKLKNDSGKALTAVKMAANRSGKLPNPNNPTGNVVLDDQAEEARERAAVASGWLVECDAAFKHSVKVFKDIVGTEWVEPTSANFGQNQQTTLTTPKIYAEVTGVSEEAQALMAEYDTK